MKTLHIMPMMYQIRNRYHKSADLNIFDIIRMRKIHRSRFTESLRWELEQ